MQIHNPLSFAANVLITLSLIAALTFYYPKYKFNYTEATISWDAAGYCYYLPAFLIYKDARQLGFSEGIMGQYRPSASHDMAYKHESGNYVMKYSVGQALIFLPFFLIAHVFALSSAYPADGFSLPYQFAIAHGTLLFCLVGLWLLRRLLLRRFTDGVVAITLLCIALGTNYFEYASISTAMTHGNLFTLYVVLLLLTERFYTKPSYTVAAGIGLVIGWCALIRPTEIMTAMLPVLWGLSFPLLASVRERLTVFREHAAKLIVAVMCTAAVGSIQLLYWKYASGNWIVYSYGDQGFYWTKPHLINGLWSYRNGWLLYSPMMYFALAGLAVLLWRRSAVAVACVVFSTVFIYVTFAWDIWWYGGSLGQRAMVQAYPVLSFGFAALVREVVVMRIPRYAFSAVALFFVYYNLWLVYQAHGDGLYRSAETTRAYFHKTFLSYDRSKANQKLLDTNEMFSGNRSHVKAIYMNDFESETAGCVHTPIHGSTSMCVSPGSTSPVFSSDVRAGDGEWLRVSGVFRCSPKEWDTWKMPQFTVQFYENDVLVKERMIRIHRLLDEGQTDDVYFDTRMPKNATRVTALVRNESESVYVVFDDLRFEVFQ